ncbi:hypothetical protein Q3G72_027926 [Acer saccharum]|nr:hypothetical protein Q3G72_027926 [Acer saccharum]
MPLMKSHNTRKEKTPKFKFYTLTTRSHPEFAVVECRQQPATVATDRTAPHAYTAEQTCSGGFSTFSVFPVYPSERQISSGQSNSGVVI